MSLERPRRGLPFSAKAYLTTTLVVVVVAAALIGASIIAQSRALERALDRQGRALCQSLGEAVRVGLVLRDAEFVRDSARGVLRLPDLRFATFFDTDGAAIIRIGPAAPDFTPSSDMLAGAVQEGTVDLRLPAGDGSGPTQAFLSAVRSERGSDLVGYVGLGFSRTAIEREQREALTVFLATGALLLVMACVATYLLIGNLVRPLTELANGARRISRGDLAVQVVHAAPDEVGRLSEAFNAMAASLRESSRAVALKTAALAASERKYRQLFEEIDMPLVILDPLGRFLDCNDAAVVLCGLSSRAEAIGHELLCPFLTADGKPNTLMDEILDHPDGVRGREVSWTRHDGTEVHALLSAKATRGDHGQHVAVEGMLTDITSIKVLQSQLFQAQKLESIGTLAGGVAHDFNNLLVIITMCGERLLAGADPGDPRHKWAARILNAGERGTELVRNLLRFARQETETRRELFDPADVARKLVELLSGTINPRIQLSLHAPEQSALVDGDPGQIHQVLMNLCVNACDAIAEADGSHLDIVVNATRVTDAMCAAIPDGPAGPARPNYHCRRRNGHRASDPSADIRPLLHHQGTWKGHRPGPCDDLWHREGPPGIHDRRFGAGRRQPLPRLPARRATAVPMTRVAGSEATGTPMRVPCAANPRGPIRRQVLTNRVVPRYAETRRSHSWRRSR